MKTFLTILRMILTLPALIFGWCYVLLACSLGLAYKLKLNTKQMVLSAVWRKWVLKHWRYSTALSRGIIYQPNSRLNKRSITHEYIHVEQVEDRVLLSLIVGAIVGIVFQSWPAFVALWCSGVVWQLPNFLGAILRSENIYRGAEHEESAYSQTDDL